MAREKEYFTVIPDWWMTSDPTQPPSFIPSFQKSALQNLHVFNHTVGPKSEYAACTTIVDALWMMEEYQ